MVLCADVPFILKESAEDVNVAIVAEGLPERLLSAGRLCAEADGLVSAGAASKNPGPQAAVAMPAPQDAVSGIFSGLSVLSMYCRQQAFDA